MPLVVLRIPMAVPLVRAVKRGDCLEVFDEHLDKVQVEDWGGRAAWRSTNQLSYFALASAQCNVRLELWHALSLSR
jgi:hypothetical protein